MPVTSTDLLTPFLTGPAEEEIGPEEVPTPAGISPLGQRLYAALKPLAYADDRGDLLNYCDALMQAGQQADTYGSDTADLPGWAILMDPQHCPEEVLVWLAQLAGVDLSQLTRASVISALQNLILNPNFNHSRLAHAPLRWISVENVLLEVTEGWEAGRKALFVETKLLAAGKSAVAQAEGATVLPGISPATLVQEQQFYSVRANLNIVSITKQMSFVIKVEFYNINGELLEEQSTAAVNTAGVHLLSGVFESPEHAEVMIYKLVATSGEANSKATYYIDEAAITLSPEGKPMAYGDGDTADWSWSGEAGNSSSGKLQLQTNEEFVQSKRDRIVQQPSSARGTPAAILAAAQQYLVGNKTVFMQERDGSAYRLTIVTYSEETPDIAKVEAALAEQVPAGIVLTYVAVSGATYILIRATYASYEEVKEEYKTYNGLRLNLPGT